MKGNIKYLLSFLILSNKKIIIVGYKKKNKLKKTISFNELKKKFKKYKNNCKKLDLKIVDNNNNNNNTKLSCLDSTSWYRKESKTNNITEIKNKKHHVSTF